jgi:hypothetical protein
VGGDGQGGGVSVNVTLRDPVAVQTKGTIVNSAGRGAVTTTVALLLACAWAFRV